MDKIFAIRLRELRQEKGLTQAQLGVLMNVAGSTVRGWEIYQREPNHQDLCKLAKIFDVTVGQLLGVED
ncbi:MAG: helix-turn-helix domain-containing protein [Firmicutes bacterium]|nr:helix-turn-helix domain-containing protein [Bacillota bacterium]